MPETGKLKMAIMVNQLSMARWEHLVLEQLEASGKVEAVCWISRKESLASLKPGLISRLKNFRYKLFLWKLYGKFRKQVRAMEEVGVFEAYSRIPVLFLEPELLPRNREKFKQEDLISIKNYSPDFILRFGFNILQGEILDLAPYGIWSYHHDDPEIIRGGPPGFWEVFKGMKNTGLVLQRLTEKLDDGIVLRKGQIKTVLHSYHGNLQQLLECGVEWPLQVVEEILAGHSIAANEHKTVSKLGKFYSYPSNFSMLIFFLLKLKRWVGFHFQDILQAEKWNIGIVSGESFMQVNPKQAQWFPECPRGSFVADPFASLKQPGKIFAEYYSYQKTKGEIHAFNCEGIFQKVVLKESRHLSFPFTFIYENREMIMPEQAQSGKVLAFDPVQTENKFLLLDNFEAVDSNLIFYQKKWWLFCSNEKKGSNSHLYIFFSEDLKSGFKPHPQNPVKIDVEGARPAGSIVEHGGKLFRPGQNCSNSYGSGVIWFEILNLNETQYKEQKYFEINPDDEGKYPQGLHTMNRMEGGWLIDGKRFEFSFWHSYHKLRKKIK